MHVVEDRPSNLSLPCAATKPIFPIPVNGQTLMYPAANTHTPRCDHGRASLHSIPHSLNHSRCSCGEGISPATANAPATYNRLLLPATTHSNEQLRTQPGLSASLNATESWLRLPAASQPNYESLLLNGFPLYGRFSGDNIYPSLDHALLANARRKNATRETTSTLKAWLNEHKKNPYPTKGEKIMLAILTKMTLTQVSTWFANARRRLKKENKMTWSPRKKTGEKKVNADGEMESVASDSDIEGMDVDVDGVLDSSEKENEEVSPVTFTSDIQSMKKEDIELQNIPSSEPLVQRPSVIRTVESPTFNEIRDRFKDEVSPVRNLQKWVEGCSKVTTQEINEFPDELTPPSTPIENKVTTFSAQTLFEAFDATKSKSAVKSNAVKPPIDTSYTKEPLQLIFSSKQPVCSAKVSHPQQMPMLQSSLSVQSSEIPSGVMTPQPSPKNETQFTISKESQVTDNKLSPPTFSDSKESQPEVRVQGLTTSRELEAVLALTNLYKC